MWALERQAEQEGRLTRAGGATGAMTLIQRFSSALDLNTHFHMLVLDGAYLVGTEPPVFRRITPCLVRCEHPMKSRQMHPRRRYQRRKGREAAATELRTNPRRFMWI